MWIDEGLNSFFRRLAFTPDGSFLIVPGMYVTLHNYTLSLWLVSVLKCSQFELLPVRVEYCI